MFNATEESIIGGAQLNYFIKFFSLFELNISRYFQQIIQINICFCLN